MLGLDHLGRDDLSGGEWIVPPFQLLRNAFSKGGPFTRAGKIPPVELDQHAVTYLTGDWQIYRPDLAAFVPDYADGDIPEGADPATIDRSEWRLTIWIAGAAVRMAEGADRDRLLVPWTSFAIGYLDLWLEQYRCYHLGLPVPTELSEPEEDSSFPDTDSTTTTAGLVLIPRVLDEPAGESEGKHLLRVEVATSSRIEQAVWDAGHEPNGYFLAGLAAYVAGGVDGLAPDPEGDGVSFLGGEEDLAKLREQLVAATSDVDQLAALIRRAEAEGFDFDD